MVEHGPWFLELEPVLERRDQDRRRLWKRQENKRLKRNSSKQKGAQPAGENPAGRTITPAGSTTRGNTFVPVVDIATADASSRAKTPDLPSSDLLRSIHHEAMLLYTSHDVLTIPTPHRGPRPRNWEEPIAMARALDGSALMAIGVLLEEITRDQIESGLLSALPTDNAES